MKTFYAFLAGCVVATWVAFLVSPASAGSSPFDGDPFIVEHAQSWIRAAYPVNENAYDRFYAAYFAMNNVGTAILIEGRNEQATATQGYEREEARMKVALGRLLVESANQVTFP